MKFDFGRVLTICLITSIIFISCKKEENNISDDIEPNNGQNQVENIFGCMVDTACNYNSLANIDNESCDYSCYGCMDKVAFNYSSDATIDDGSCIYANQLMLNTWSVESNCDGFIMSALIPNEVTIESGDNDGDLVVDFGLFSLEGTIDNAGNISIDGEDPTGVTQLTGVGFLQSETNVQINITATVTLLSENCTLMLTLIE